MVEDKSPDAARSEPSLSRTIGVVMRAPRKAAPSSPISSDNQSNLKNMKLGLSHSERAIDAVAIPIRTVAQGLGESSGVIGTKVSKTISDEPPAVSM